MYIKQYLSRLSSPLIMVGIYHLHPENAKGKLQQQKKNNRKAEQKSGNFSVYLGVVFLAVCVPAKHL